jgi:hypothetical protein
LNIDNISVEADGDIVFVTIAKYKLFLSYGKIGMDAYLLYSHLIFTARLQKTNCVKANNIYIRTGLKWTKERLRKAKNLLNDLNMIETIKRRDKKGLITGWYIEVKTKTTSFEIESSDLISRGVDIQRGGKQTPNALTKNQMLKQEKNAYSKSEKIDFELSTFFYELIIKHVNPSRKKKPNFETWAGHINKLRRLDGVPEDVIRSVMEWTVKSDFWKSNVLSTAKFRLQFDVLEAQSKRVINKVETPEEKSKRVTKETLELIERGK